MERLAGTPLVLHESGIIKLCSVILSVTSPRLKYVVSGLSLRCSGSPYTNKIISQTFSATKYIVNTFVKILNDTLWRVSHF